MMEDFEIIKAELIEFEKGGVSQLSELLEKVLYDLGTTGVPYFEWYLLRAIIAAKMKESLTQFNCQIPYDGSYTTDSFEKKLEHLNDTLYAFDGAPFTLQRLVEVICAPRKTYNNVQKLLNALEKLLAVTSVLPVADPHAVKVEPDVSAPNKYVDDGVSHSDVEANGSNLDIAAKAPWVDTTELKNSEGLS